MDVKLVEKANAINEEIKNLKEYKRIQKSNKDTIHFEMVAHYGNVRDSDKIQISRKHTTLLFEVVDLVIRNLEAELKAL